MYTCQLFRIIHVGEDHSNEAQVAAICYMTMQSCSFDGDVCHAGHSRSFTQHHSTASLNRWQCKVSIALHTMSPMMQERTITYCTLSSCCKSTAYIRLHRLGLCAPVWIRSSLGAVQPCGAHVSDRVRSVQPEKECETFSRCMPPNLWRGMRTISPVCPKITH